MISILNTEIQVKHDNLTCEHTSIFHTLIFQMNYKLALCNLNRRFQLANLWSMLCVISQKICI